MTGLIVTSGEREEGWEPPAEAIRRPAKATNVSNARAKR